MINFLRAFAWLSGGIALALTALILTANPAPAQVAPTEKCEIGTFEQYAAVPAPEGSSELHLQGQDAEDFKQAYTDVTSQTAPFDHDEFVIISHPNFPIVQFAYGKEGCILGGTQVPKELIAPVLERLAILQKRRAL